MNPENEAIKIKAGVGKKIKLESFFRKITPPSITNNLKIALSISIFISLRSQLIS